MTITETRTAAWLDLVRSLAGYQISSCSIKLRDADIDAGIRVASPELIRDWLSKFDLVELAGPEAARHAASRIDSERHGAAGYYAGLVNARLRMRCEAELRYDVTSAVEQDELAEKRRRGLSFVGAEL